MTTSPPTRKPPRTYAVKLGAGSDGMPTSLFDPRWRDPAVAARVAFVLYCRSGADLEGAAHKLLDDVPALPPELTDARDFRLAHVYEVASALDAPDVPDALRKRSGARRFKGGSYGELHRHYAFGKYTVNFHAQAVSFGFDDAGAWFLASTVGRFDGPWGNDAVLSVRWRAGRDVVGASVWHRALDPVGDLRVRLSGQDARLAQRFDEIDLAEVAFTARHGKDVPAATEPDKPKAAPKLSRARRSVIARELQKLLAGAEAPGRTAQLRKLLAGVAPDEVRELVAEVAPGIDATAIVHLLETGPTP